MKFIWFISTSDTNVVLCQRIPKCATLQFKSLLLDRPAVGKFFIIFEEVQKSNT